MALLGLQPVDGLFPESDCMARPEGFASTSSAPAIEYLVDFDRIANEAARGADAKVINPCRAARGVVAAPLH